MRPRWRLSGVPRGSYETGYTKWRPCTGNARFLPSDHSIDVQRHTHTANAQRRR